MKIKKGTEVRARGLPREKQAYGSARSDMVHCGKFVGMAAIIEVTLEDGQVSPFYFDADTIEVVQKN